MRPPIETLTRRLGYRFRDPGLLEIALTHRSAGSGNNERFEFLGDAVLSFVISDELLHRFPAADEGTLSRLRSRLVKGETLAGVARALSLGEYLHLGSGELKSGGARRASILADALEAVIGAAYVDSGTEAARALVLGLLAEEIESVSPNGVLKDPKTRLQEYLQSRRLPLPEYDVLAVSGDAHDQTFEVACRVPGIEQPVRGVAGSRRKAEQSAAATALEKLGSA